MPRKKPHDWYDKWTLGLLVATFIALVAYTSVALWQAYLTQKTVTEMQADQRPWIAVVVTIDQPLFFSNWGGDKGLLLPLKFTMKNYGRSPAVNIHITGELVKHLGNANDARNVMNAAQKAKCTEAEKESISNPTGGITIFPTDTQSVFQSFGSPVFDNSPILYSIRGCIDYTYAKTLHGQAGFRMLLGKIRDTQWGGISFLNNGTPEPNYSAPPGSKLPAPTIARLPVSEVDFGVDPIGGNYAE